MDLQLSVSDKGNFIRQIYRQLRERILDGSLKSGDKLPSSRELAEELGVARKTITNVYDLLISEGFLDTRRGSGTFVAQGILGQRISVSRPASLVTVSEEWDRLSTLLTPKRRTLPFDFNVGVPDISRFPFPLWRSIIGSCARLLSPSANTYAEPQGYKPLREAIVKYTSFTRAVVCTPQDVVVTNGAQQAFALISYALVRPGSVVVMEKPGYEMARWLFETHGAHVIDVPVDEDGLIVEQLPHQAKVVYVTPSHQFPLGVCMSLPRRLALLQWAAKHGAVIIEDDYDSEFRFASRPLDSLQSLDKHGIVLYVGTFSKVLFPGVRTGFVIAPEPVRRALVAARQLSDWHGSILMQATLERFIREGHLARHIRKMRGIYAHRRKVLLSCLEAEPSQLLKLWSSKAGLHIAISLKKDLSANAVAESAKLLGVGVMSIDDHSLALGYGAIESALISEGIERLKQSLLPHL